MLRNIHFMTSKLKINLSQNQQVQVDNEEPFRILIELRPDMAPKVRLHNFHSKPISLSINKQHMHQWKSQFLLLFADSAPHIFISLFFILIAHSIQMCENFLKLCKGMPDGRGYLVRIFFDKTID